MLATVEKELSLKSNHELRHEQDLMRVEFLKLGDTEEVDIEEASKQTAVEFEDACTEELKAFTPAPITTGESFPLLKYYVLEIMQLDYM